MNINAIISQELQLPLHKVEQAVILLDEGSTVPFIARYRKEVTGNLTDVELRNITERLAYLRNLEERKKTVCEQIISLEKMTPELQEKIDTCMTLSALEDIYRPYKPKKETRGSIAVKKGLKPLADYILDGRENNLEDEANKYIDEKKGVKDSASAIKGALDIIAEVISDNTNYRVYIKKLAYAKGFIQTKKVEDTQVTTYDNYADYKEAISKIKPHRVLACNRGSKEKVLTRTILLPDEEIIEHIASFEISKVNNYRDMLVETIKDSYNRLIYPSVCNDLYSDLFEKAEDASIVIFKSNLHNLLLEAPVTNKVIMGFDPGFRTGCKIAIIDPHGQVLATDVLYATTSDKRIDETKARCKALIDKYHVTMIALGNGTASRESEKFLKEVLVNCPGCEYAIVSEAGASVYSASKVGEKEFPDFDVSLRSAVSIARRLLDPLAELVKIEPMAIGVGQYQHDMNPKKLTLALVGVIEDAVNLVGVDINSASGALLSYISGISPAIANNIVDYRSKNGAFKNRDQLLKVKGFGPKAFENSAGFLRVDGDEPLDKTGIHPESYELARKVLEHFKVKTLDEYRKKEISLTDEEIKTLATTLNCGELTLSDIIRELSKPYRDPRDKVVTAKLNNSITKIEELVPGMVLEGTVRNVMDFGCFVDIGVHYDGLVHISELSDKFVSDINSLVKVGQIVKVYVMSVDLTRNRIALSMKKLPKEGE